MKDASTEQITKAKALYLSGGSSIAEIAEQTGIGPHTIKQWIKSEKWVAKKQEIQKKAMESAETEVLDLVQGNKLDTLRRHLDASKLIELRIISQLEARNVHGEPAYISPRDLAILAKALKDATDVSGRAVGLDQENSKHGGIMPMVIVGLQPRRLSEAEAKAIDVIDVTEDPF